MDGQSETVRQAAGCWIGTPKFAFGEPVKQIALRRVVALWSTVM